MEKRLSQIENASSTIDNIKTHPIFCLQRQSTAALENSDMAIVEINWNPSRKELKAFSLLLIVFFAIVAGLAHRRGASTGAALLIACGGAVVGVAGLVFPKFIHIVYVVWMAAVSPIGMIVSNVVLALVFFGVVCPIGLLSRLTGRNALQLGFDREARTYWNVRKPITNPRRYFRQY